MIIKSLFLQPLGPAIVLVLGASLLALGRHVASGQMARAGAYRKLRGTMGTYQPLISRLRLPVALLILLAAALVLAALRSPAAHPVLQRAWQPLTVAGGLLEWRMDGWNWLAAGLILLLVTTAVLLDDETPSLRQLGENGSPVAPWQQLNRSAASMELTFWLGAAALIFTSAANVVTLASCWVLLDAALALRLRPGMKAEPASRAWGLLSLTGLLLLLVLVLLGESGIRTELGSRSLGRGELALLWLVALVGAGIYPLHFWLIGPGHGSRSERVALCVICPVTGLWLLGRLHGAAASDWLSRPEWAVLGAFALLGTGLMAWAEAVEARRWRWIALNRASLVVLVAYMAGSPGPEALVWALVTFSLGSALLIVGQTAQQCLGWRVPAWLAVLALWGLPGTTGFLARSVLVYPTQLPVAVPLFGIVLLAEILLVAALWQAAKGEGSPAKHPTFSRQKAAVLGLAVVLLAGPLIVWGLMPRLMASLSGWPVGDLFPTLRATVIQARKSVWAGLGLSAVLGVTLGLLRGRIFGQMAGWQRGMVAIVSLEWLYQMAAFGFSVLASGLQYFARLGEGEGYLGWLALAGLILWVLLRG